MFQVSISTYPVVYIFEVCVVMRELLAILGWLMVSCRILQALTVAPLFIAAAMLPAGATYARAGQLAPPPPPPEDLQVCDLPSADDQPPSLASRQTPLGIDTCCSERSQCGSALIASSLYYGVSLKTVHT